MAIDRETQVMMDAHAAGIRSPRELANFMAQVTHESNGLNRLEESFRYTRNIYQIPVQAAWREGSDTLEAARKDALQGKPERLAELMYGGRNGNDDPGDGWTYRGRGYIQLTGKDNYRAAGDALGMDLVDKPELAADPKHASKIAAWYWETRVPDQAREDVKAATQAINGKFNGLEDRERRFGEWERRLTPEVMQRLESGSVGKPLPSDRILAEGMHGEDVRQIQGRLHELGYTGGEGQPLHVDGRFGPATRHALASFQRDQGISADGIVGATTRSAMGTRLDQQADAPASSKANPGLEDFALLDQARHGVHELDRQRGRQPDQFSENLTGSLAAAAKRDGLDRIDHVVLSDDASRAYAIQGDLDSPLKRMAEVQTAQAVNRPFEESVKDMVGMSGTRRHAQTDQQQQTNTPAGPAM